MIDPSDLQLGATYIRRPIPTWPKERKGILVKTGDYLVELRDPVTGLVHTECVTDLEGPVEPEPPPKICPVCEDRRVVVKWRQVEPWKKVLDGEESCPMCSGS